MGRPITQAICRAAEPCQLLADEPVVLVEESMPALVSQLGSTVGRSDDVGEQRGGQDPVGFGCRADTGEEFRDLVQGVGAGQPALILWQRWRSRESSGIDAVLVTITHLGPGAPR